VFWVADLASDAQLREGFSQAVFSSIPQGEPLPDAPFRTWEAAFRYVGRMAANKPLCVVVDEYPYLTQADSSISSVLKRLWDLELSRTRLKLILCGSHVGMMEREILSGKAPLFGRRTLNVQVLPLAPSTLRQLFKRYTAAQRVELYSVFGGIPKYLLACDEDEDPLANATRLLLQPTGLFYDEPLYLFREELSDPRNYLAIVRAIAGGRTTHNEIVQATGIDRGLVSRHLDTLQRLRLVGRRVPVTEDNPERSRKSIYQLADPLVRFWYRFVAPNKASLDAGALRRVVDVVRRDFADYVAPTFEGLCRQYVTVVMESLVGAEDARVGAWWSARGEIDVVALSARARTALLCECKWSVNPAGEGVLESLAERAGLLGLGEKTTRRYAIFSRSGFTSALKRKARAAGVRLLTLDDMESAGIL
jgi:hypothetical protein